MTGTALVLDSMTKNRTSSKALPVRDTITQGLLQGNWLPPMLRPSSWAESAVTKTKAPRKSIFSQICFVERVVLLKPGWLQITYQPRTKAAAEIGTCSKKHQRHPIWSAIAPPNEAPAIAPNPT